MPDLTILAFLNKAYLRMFQNDCKDFIFQLCEPPDVEEPVFPYPVLRQTQTIPANGSGEHEAPMPSCVSVIPDNFEDANGDPITFVYHNQTITCRKVNAFFVESDIFSRYWSLNSTYIEPYTPYYNTRYVGSRFYNRQFVRYPCDLRPPDQEVPAQAFFSARPYEVGVSSTTPALIFCEFWMTPPSMTTLDSKMLIDTDRWQDELEDGAVGYWEKEVNGDSRLWEKFIKFDRKVYMNESNSNLHNKTNQQYAIREIG